MKYCSDICNHCEICYNCGRNRKQKTVVCDHCGKEIEGFHFYTNGEKDYCEDCLATVIIEENLYHNSDSNLEKTIFNISAEFLDDELIKKDQNIFFFKSVPNELFDLNRLICLFSGLIQTQYIWNKRKLIEFFGYKDENLSED